MTQLLHSRFPIDDPSLDKGIHPERRARTTKREERSERSVSARQSATVTNPLLVTRALWVSLFVQPLAAARDDARGDGAKGNERERGGRLARIDAFMHDARADRAIIFSFSFRGRTASCQGASRGTGRQNAATMAACTNRK